jgi:glycosyltransferase involved in cell wall biosynthesis
MTFAMKQTQVNSKPVKFLIVTPTYNRDSLLLRLIRQVRRQTYPHWELIVVHDGPSRSTEALVGQFRTQDSRIKYYETAISGKDYGVTPRLEGLRRAVQEDPPSYAVFWDDDDYFVRTALEKIANSLRAANFPALLLSPNRYRNRINPPPGISIRGLRPGQLSNSNLAIRTSLALEAYERQIVMLKNDSSKKLMNIQDYLIFDGIRKLRPRLSIEIARGEIIGINDGLRRQVYLRHLLRIPPLGILNRERTNRLRFWK